MKKKIGKFLIVVLALMALLAGCIDIEEDIVINSDGSGSFRLAMVMDASIASMMEEGESESFLNEDDFPDAEINSFVDADGNSVDEVVMYFDDLASFVEEFNTSSDDGGMILGYENLGDTIRFTHTIEGSESESGGALGDSGDMFGAEMLEGLEWKLSITAPGISDTNGNLSEDFNTASWRIPLTQLSTPDGHEAYIEYSSGGAGSNLLMIGGIAVACCFGLLVLIAGILAIFFYVRNQNKTKEVI